MKVYAASILTQQVYNNLWRTEFLKQENNGNIITKNEKFPVTLYNEQGKTYTIDNHIIDTHA